MNQPIDYSDRLAYLQVCIGILQDLEPDGKWKEHKILTKWQRRRYSVTRKELGSLENFLESERKRVTAPKPLEVSQFSLFE